MNRNVDHKLTRNEPSLSRAAVRALVAVAMESDESRLRWTERDLEGMWRQYLRTSIIADFTAFGGVMALQADDLIQRHPAPAPETFGQLLAHPAPSSVLLDLTREIALQRLSDPEAAVGQQIHRALHALLSLVMRLRCEASPAAAGITAGMTDPELRRRADWIMKQRWIDDTSKSLAREALAQLDVSDYPT